MVKAVQRAEPNQSPHRSLPSGFLGIVRLQSVATKSDLVASENVDVSPDAVSLATRRGSVSFAPGKCAAPWSLWTEWVVTMNEVTCILSAIEGGDPQAAAQLLPLVYDELRTLAAQKLALEAPGQTLQATALVHDAYLRLVGNSDPGWDSRGHFFAAAAEAMRRILIENARRKAAVKAGGGRQRLDLAQAEPAIAGPDLDLLALDEALEALEAKDPRKAQLVKLRYFAGLTIDQAAQVLGISASTADNDWAYTRSWLRLAMLGDEKDELERSRRKEFWAAALGRRR